MQSICYFLLFVASVVTARELTFSDPKMPINMVQMSYGHGDNERIDHLRAVIRPRHITNKERVEFATFGDMNEYFTQIRSDGDKRGHLVAAQFSGPDEWYNLSPQNVRVNRESGYQALTTDWYGTECEVRRFLEEGGDRFVLWIVNNSYVDDSNRPDIYHLQVSFFEGRNLMESIDTRIRNPLKSEDSNFWSCESCRSNRQQHDEMRKKGIGCSLV